MRKRQSVKLISNQRPRPFFLAVTLILLSAGLFACATVPVADTARDPEQLFARGKALLLATEASLGLDREPVNVGMGALTSQQYSDFSAARLDLLDAYTGKPGAAWEPEARLLAARALDYGRLQLFPRAVEEYRELARLFPGTPEAAVAAERATALGAKFDDFHGIDVPKGASGFGVTPPPDKP